MSSDGHPTLLHFIVFIAVLLFATVGLLTFTKNEPVLRAQSTGLISYWQFEEGGDFLSNSVSGFMPANAVKKPTGATPTSVSGIIGKALSFDGIDDYVDFGDSSADVFNTLNYPFTVSAWIKVNGPPINGPDLPILATDDEATYTGFQFMVEGETPTYQLVVDLMNGQGSGSANRISKTSIATVTPNAWTHVAVAVGGPNDINLYMDCGDAGGTYTGTASAGSLNPLPHAFPLAGSPNFSRAAAAHLGKRGSGGGGFFNGQIDDFRIYNRKLSASEVCENNWPTLPAPKPVVSLSASPASITSGGGQTSTISWSVQGPVTSCVPSAVPVDVPWGNVNVPSSSNYTDFDALWSCLYQSPSGPCAPGDIDANGSIDSNDVTAFTTHAQKYDINGDGVANLSNDLQPIKSCLYKDVASNPSCSVADLNNDGWINLLDVAQFKLHLGRYNFNGSDNFSVEYTSSSPQTGSKPTGALSFTSHLFTLSCTGPGGVGVGTTSVLPLVPPACSDGLDNDGDGKIDYSATPGVGDQGCVSAADTNEYNATVCGNGRCERALGETPLCKVDCNFNYFRDF